LSKFYKMTTTKRIAIMDLYCKLRKDAERIKPYLLDSDYLRMYNENKLWRKQILNLLINKN